MELLLLHLLPARSHGLADIAVDGARVRFCPLATYREVPRVTDTPVRLDVLEPFNVPGDLAPQIALKLEFFNDPSHLVFLLARKIGWPRSSLNMRGVQNFLRPNASDTKKRGKADLKTFRIRNVYAQKSHNLAELA